MTIENINGRYIINRDDGSKVVLTCNEASLLINYCGKEGLRQQINYQLDDVIDNGDCDLEKYNGTREEFIQEVFEYFEDEIDYGNSVDDSEISDKIYDLVTEYGLD